MYAAIDIGSNTIRLAVFELSGGRPVCTYDKKYMAKLIEHVIDGTLDQNAVNILAEVLKEYKNTAEDMGANALYVFATASLRAVKNCSDVLSYIKRETDLDIDIISGEQEARLSFIAARSVFPADTCLIADIGGGSSEIVAAENGSISAFDSLPAGSLKMYMKYVSQTIPSPAEALLIKNEISDMLSRSFNKQQFDTLIGIGGSIKAICKLISAFGIDTPGDIINVGYLRSVCQILIENHPHAISAINNIIPDRLTTLLPGAIIADAISEYFGCKKIQVCHAGVREGYIIDKICK